MVAKCVPVDTLKGVQNGLGRGLLRPTFRQLVFDFLVFSPIGHRHQRNLVFEPRFDRIRASFVVLGLVVESLK